MTVVAWRTGGFFQADADDRNLTVVRLLMLVVLAAFFYALPGVVRRARRGALIAFGVWLAYLGLWLFSLWPGIVMSDTVTAVDESRRASVFEWFSWLHSVLNIAVLDLVPHVGGLAVLQIAVVAATMAYATQVLLDFRASVPSAVVMNVVAALSVPIVTNALLLSRDTLFAMAHVVLALAAAQVVTGQRRPSVARIAGLACLTGALSVYRGDGVALLVVVPLLLAIALRPRRVQLAVGAAAFVGAWALFAFALPATLDVRDESRKYAVSLRLNPLGAVLRTDFYSLDRERDLRELSRVINVDAVRDAHVPYEIPAFWSGAGWNAAASEADFAAFKETADRLLLENMTTVLASRVETFGAASGIGPGQFSGVPYGLEGRFDWVPIREGVAARPPSPDLYDAAHDVLQSTEDYRGAISIRSALFWNFLPWLALLAATLPFWRRVPFAATVALIVLCRVPLVFLAAPAAQFKYYLSVELGGIVVLGLLLTGVRRARVNALRARLRGRSAPEPASA